MGAQPEGAETVDISDEVRHQKVGKTLENNGASVQVTLYDAKKQGWTPETPVRVKYLGRGRIVIEACGETPQPAADGGDQ